MPPLTPRALERRLKRYVWGETHDFLAVCAPGLEAVLLGEVRGLPGVTDLVRVRGGVSFRGPFESLYHANLELATAHRVLWRIGAFLAQSYPMLFNKARRLPWERFVGFQQEVAYHVAARASRLRHGPKIAATLHSALSDALAPLGLGAAHVEAAPLTVHARLFRDRCTLSLDTSGEHLHRRGYRTHVGEAPLRETLAAGILLALGAPAFDLIVDPMCGSGTLLIEAERLARRRPPGEFRRFAFEHFPSFRPPATRALGKRRSAPPRRSACPAFTASTATRGCWRRPRTTPARRGSRARSRSLRPTRSRTRSHPSERPTNGRCWSATRPTAIAWARVGRSTAASRPPSNRSRGGASPS